MAYSDSTINTDIESIKTGFWSKQRDGHFHRAYSAIRGKFDKLDGKDRQRALESVGRQVLALEGLLKKREKKLIKEDLLTFSDKTLQDIKNNDIYFLASLEELKQGLPEGSTPEKHLSAIYLEYEKIYSKRSSKPSSSLAITTAHTAPEPKATQTQAVQSSTETEPEQAEDKYEEVSNSDLLDFDSLDLESFDPDLYLTQMDEREGTYFSEPERGSASASAGYENRNPRKRKATDTSKKRTSMKRSADQKKNCAFVELEFLDDLITIHIKLSNRAVLQNSDNILEISLERLNDFNYKDKNHQKRLLKVILKQLNKEFQHESLDFIDPATNSYTKNKHKKTWTEEVYINIFSKIKENLLDREGRCKESFSRAIKEEYKKESAAAASASAFSTPWRSNVAHGGAAAPAQALTRQALE